MEKSGCGGQCASGEERLGWIDMEEVVEADDSAVESSLRGSISGFGEGGVGDGETSGLVISSASDSSTTRVVSVVFCVDGTGDPVNNNASSSVIDCFNSCGRTGKSITIPSSKK
jgi:hypothetical protein